MSTDYESVGDIRCNPWVSDVVPPIEQNLHSFEFPEDVETALRNAEKLPAQAEDRSGIITNPIIAARKELSDLPGFDILSRTKGGFYDHYKAGDASVADVMRYTLGAATAKPEAMKHVGFYCDNIWYRKAYFSLRC